MSSTRLEYDPFVRGPFPVGIRTIQAADKARGRVFPVEIWYPADALHAGQDLATPTQDSFTIPSTDIRRCQMAVRDASSRPGIYPLVVFSHGSPRGARRMATYLCTHLSSHGYIVAALDHFEVVAADVEKAALLQAVIENRPLDLLFLVDYVLNELTWDADTRVDPAQIGAVGYSFGGWTVLAAAERDQRLRALVALAPAGSSNPKPGVAPVTLGFDWGRDVPTLYLAAENDSMTPLQGICELFDRTPATKQMVILRRADHAHFLDDVETEHENVRNMEWPEQLAWINKEMRPISEHCSGEEANLFARGMTVCYFDAVLKQRPQAQQLLAGDIESKLSHRGLHVVLHRPQR